MRLIIPLVDEIYELQEDAKFTGSSGFTKYYQALGIPNESQYTNSPRYYELKDWAREVFLPKGTRLVIKSLWFARNYSNLVRVGLSVPGSKRKPVVYFTRNQLALLELEQI